MKKLCTLFMMVAIYINAFAQSPQKMSYQAVIRNTANALVTSHIVGMRISILQGSASGTVIYTETQTPTTNANGLVSIEIGGGPGFNTIDWANNTYFIKTETDPTGGASYTITGTSQLLSVPYALYSKTAQTADYNNLTNLPNLSGYLTSESDPVFVASPAHGITNGNITNWNTAYGWGNHASAGYVPNTRTLTINGTILDLTVNRSWSVGTVTSVGLSLPSIFSLSGSPVTTTGTLTAALASQSANQVFASPNASAGTPIFRALVAADIPNLDWSKITSGKPTTTTGYGITDAVTITGDQTISGIKTFTNDCLINGLTVGRGKGAYSSNAAYGYSALPSNTNGGFVTAIGYQALYSNTTGSSTTAIGGQALYSNMNGNYNTGIGSYAGYNNISGSGNVFLGTQAGYYETGSQKLFIDNQQRANELDARTKSLIYGVFDANPANQILTINGKVGIGTLTPGGKFAINNGPYGGLLIDVKNDGVSWLGSYTNIQTGDYAWGNNSTASNLVLQGSGGNVGVGAEPGIYKLYVAGNAFSTGGFSSSDARWKKNIIPLVSVLDKILLLKGINFDWRKDEFPEIGFDSGTQIGLIAQDVEKVFPELVRTDDNGYKAVAYEKLSVLLIEGMKEQQKQIKDQQKDIDKLKALVTSLIANQTGLGNK